MPAFQQRPPKSRISAGAIIAIVIGCVVLLCCGIGAIGAAMSGSKKDDKAATSSSKSSTAAEVPSEGDSKSTPTKTKSTPKETKKAEAAPGLNTPVRDGKFEFVVLSIECGKPEVGAGFLTKKAQGQYCVVALSVKNIGKEPQTFFDVNQKGYSPDGAEYSTDSAATLALAGDQPAWVNQINPGNSIKGSIAFDIPGTSKITKLKLHDSAFSGGVTVAVG